MQITRRDFLLAIGSVGTGFGCSPAPPIRTALASSVSSAEACQQSSGSTLSILTWNIFMMPAWIHESPSNLARASAIATVLLSERFDIVCLQKVFDRKARQLLSDALGARYPHQYGPANDSCSILLNSGVWVLSRRPLTNYQEIRFHDCTDVECFSRKGALMLTGSCNAHPFQLVTTHLQGEETSHFTPENQCVRERQMEEIARYLIEPQLGSGIPIVVCGDLGTPRLTDDGRYETTSYRRMLGILGVENAPDVRITLDEARSHNDMAHNESGRKNELDYVLLCNNGCILSVRRFRHRFQRSGWDSESPQRRDLSYRFAVSAQITFETVGASAPPPTPARVEVPTECHEPDSWQGL
ncbi:MAG TPA: sphingomyelin phosphodiesterase [Polyangiaceae bacterium]